MTESETVTDTALDNRASASSGKCKPPIIFMLVGLVTSAGLIALSGCQSMPAMTVTVYESKYQDVDQTCEALRMSIDSQGLSYLATRNLNKSMAKHGVHLDRQVRIVEFCKADYAYDMLRDNPEICTLMPCTLGVYEGDDGNVYISSMNQRLMGTMFGGTIKQVINERVTQDEARILNPHIRQGPRAAN